MTSWHRPRVEPPRSCGEPSGGTASPGAHHQLGHLEFVVESSVGAAIPGADHESESLVKVSDSYSDVILAWESDTSDDSDGGTDRSSGGDGDWAWGNGYGGKGDMLELTDGAWS